MTTSHLAFPSSVTLNGRHLLTRSKSRNPFIGCRCNIFVLFHRFFFGKNKVMIIALGKGDTDEYRDNLHKVDNIFHN